MRMLYGQRLDKAITYREGVIGRTISRKEIAKVAGCTVQNIGMILNNAKKLDQCLSTESHALVSAFLRVNPDWLLNETGDMEIPLPSNAPTSLSQAAIEMGVLYDMIPLDDKISRAIAFNQATTAIMEVLKGVTSKGQLKPDSGTPGA